MNQLLEQIFTTQIITTPDGEEQVLHSGIDRDEARFLLALIKKHKVTRTLEVGCAMGISSLAICQGIAENSHDSQHIIIDPYQYDEWKGVGVHQLQKAGFKNFHLMEAPSEYVLPKLAEENCRIDFAFIDGWHTFDHTLIDFFYINRLLRPGGILVVDDVRMPSVRRVMRMIHGYPCYRYLDGVRVAYTPKGKTVEALKTCLRPLAKLLGKRLSTELVDDSVRRSDKSLGLNASVVAFQKIAEDNRPWNWYENF